MDEYRDRAKAAVARARIAQARRELGISSVSWHAGGNSLTSMRETLHTPYYGKPADARGAPVF